MIQNVEILAPHIGTYRACKTLDVPRASVYRSRQPKQQTSKKPKINPRALSAEERANALEILNSPRYQDQSPLEIWATLVDEGTYICHVRTFYRILSAEGLVRERRDQLRHPTYQKPELLATGPNQIWTWDISILRGPVKGTYFYLYVILDIYSRLVVGWTVANHESGQLGSIFIEDTLTKHAIQPNQLTLHSDRGVPMTSKPVAFMLANLGVTKSHSRPYVSNDNPFSEAAFKTLKYCPSYPNRFGCLADATAWATAFFEWYNERHHHSGINMLTPSQVHYGKAEEVLARRQKVLDSAFMRHPERFVKGRPSAGTLPVAVWINPPVTGNPGTP